VPRAAAMSEVFEGYERQYCEASASLSRKCTAASALDGEKKKQKLSEIQSGVEEAESLVNRCRNAFCSGIPLARYTIMAPSVLLWGSS